MGNILSGKRNKSTKSSKEMDALVGKMKKAGLPKAAVDAFCMNYEQLVAGVTGMLPDSEIDAIADLPRLAAIKGDATAEKMTEILKQTAVLKLNGGLGTSMGLEKAKSLLVVKDGKTFLDIIAEQIKHTRNTFGSNVRFILMNSFSTSADTLAHLRKTHPDIAAEADLELLQNKSPKIDAASLGPASWPKAPDNEWCPPGHGDIYPSLLGSGMLDRLIKEGIKYVFVSNSDNLGATLDLNLLQYFADSGKSFVMEVAERTAADKKGGHLAKRKADGKLVLRESAMCPKEDEDKFQDIGMHKFFNTNNLWVNLPKLKAAMDAAGGVMKLPLIKNNKTVDPRDKASTKVLQLETAMGSAIECFEDSGAVVVPRERFAPVKTCADLFALRSDAYTTTEDARVVLAQATQPVVNLDDAYFKLVDDMEAHTVAPPSLTACRKLTVEGEVTFGAGVSISGEVTIINQGGGNVTLPAGAYVNETKVLGAKVAVPA